MRSLLDVNVLISLLDRDHVDHAHARSTSRPRSSTDGRRAHHPERRRAGHGAADLPKPGAPATAVGLLRDACATRHHEFWPCTPSLLDTSAVDASRLHGHRQVTDAYLLALAVRHGGRLVTFDLGVPS